MAYYDQRAYIKGVKRRIGTEAASIYAAIQNLLLAARARGIAATMTTWHLFAEADVRQILETRAASEPTRSSPWVPLGRFGPVIRRPAAEVMRRDHW